MTIPNTTYTFGEYVRKLRLERNISLTKGAELMDMPIQKLSDIEAGRRCNKHVTVDLVTRVTHAYNVPMAEVIRSVKANTTTTKSTSDILAELLPSVQMAEKTASRLSHECESYPLELFNLAKENEANIESIQVLVNFIKKRIINTKG